MLNDIRHAFRLLSRSPGFTIVACLTLGIGIGATIGIFSVVDAALFKPLPYTHANRLVDVISDVRLPNGDERGFVGVSGQRLADLRAMPSIFDGVETFGSSRGLPLANGPDESLIVGSFTTTFPAFLGVRAQIGRTFVQDDLGSASLIISDSCWKREFGGDPSVLGKTVAFADRTRVVIGVMPATFRYFAGANTDGWLPLDERKGGRLLGRLRPGLTFEQAQRDLNAVVRRGVGLAAEPWEIGQTWRLELKPADWGRSESSSRATLLTLLGAVGLVLLVACANVGNLLLARALTRQREMAVRAALGATRFQLLRQFMIEGIVLGGLGGLAALMLAWWGVRIIPAVVPAGLTYSLFGAYLPELDARVLAFALVTALASGVFCGFVPAFRSSRSVAGGLAGQRMAGDSRAQRRLLEGFQALQVAMTLVLLLGAGLLVGSLIRMILTPPGFESDRLAYVQVTLPSKSYPDAVQRFAFFDDLLGRVRSLPVVRDAALGPPPISSLSGRFSIEGRDGMADRPSLDLFFVGQGYFQVAGIPILSGRAFGPEDGPNSPPVAIISENAAKRFWPDRSPLGERFRTGSSGPPLTIVGVVGHIRTANFISDGVEAYVPLGQRDSTPYSILIKLGGDSEPVFAAIRAQLEALDPAVRIGRAKMVDDTLVEMDPMGPPRFYTGLLGLFAALGLLTAAIGLYGMLSYAVGRRTQEIGVRMALGATVSRVRWLVFVDAMGPVVIGIVIGLIASIWLSRLAELQLYQMKPHDPMTLIAVVSFLLIVCAAAALAPARRATRVNPTEALRAD